MSGKAKKTKGKMQQAVLSRTLLPMIIMGVIIVIAVLVGYRTTIKEEECKNLKIVAYSISSAFDEMYPGEYRLVGDRLLSFYKGDFDITTEYDYIEHMRQANGVEISIAMGNTRILSTLKNEYNERAIQTSINAGVVSEANKSKEPIISTAYNENIKYYACYLPLYNEEDYAGLVEVLKPVSEVDNEAWNSALPVFLITCICVIVTALIIYKYTDRFVGAIESISRFLQSMISGNLSNEMPKNVTSRNDELGITGKTVVNMQNAIRVLVERDPLTGLFNRRCGNARLRKIQKYAAVSGMPYAVAMGDIDFFKKVNDTYGHEAGDMVLKRVAEIINKAMVGKGFVARWGGEEFLIAFDKTDKEGAGKELNNILNQIRSMVILYKDMNIRVTMSFGVVDGKMSNDFGTLLNAADEKLYYAKEHGRNQVVVKEPEDQEADNTEENEEVVSQVPEQSVVIQGADFGAMIDDGVVDEIIKKFTDNVIEEEEYGDNNGE